MTKCGDCVGGLVGGELCATCNGTALIDIATTMDDEKEIPEETVEPTPEEVGEEEVAPEEETTPEL
jgi:hypothetical protein